MFPEKLLSKCEALFKAYFQKKDDLLKLLKESLKEVNCGEDNYNCLDGSNKTISDSSIESLRYIFEDMKHRNKSEKTEESMEAIRNTQVKNNRYGVDNPYGSN